LLSSLNWRLKIGSLGEKVGQAWTGQTASGGCRCCCQLSEAPSVCRPSPPGISSRRDLGGGSLEVVIKVGSRPRTPPGMLSARRCDLMALCLPTRPSSRWWGTTPPSWKSKCCGLSRSVAPSHRPCGGGWAPRGSPPSGM
jgi:hypothetical protein